MRPGGRARDPAKPGSDRKGNGGRAPDRDASTAPGYSWDASFPHRQVVGQAMPDNQWKVPGLLLLNLSLYGGTQRVPAYCPTLLLRGN